LLTIRFKLAQMFNMPDTRLSTDSRARWIVVFLIGCLLLAGPGLRAQEATAYHLGTGDRLRITVYDEKDLSGEFDVNDQGEVTLPLIGAVRLAGDTTTKAQTEIAERYGKDYLVNPRVNVQVLNYRPFFILGEVKSPGSYPYINGMTILNAVALAGGYTPRANRDRILIKHGSNSSAGEQRTSEDSPVFPGDLIRVPERLF
jgi:polysaccharide biosynthesis/export protein VpsN